jgi:hypothetical protein
MAHAVITLRAWIFFLSATCLGGWLIIIGSDPWLATAKSCAASAFLQWLFGKLADKGEAIVIAGIIAAQQAERANDPKGGAQ